MTNNQAIERSQLGPAIFDLTGRRIVLTGASKGLGRELAIAYSRFGARVVCLARSEEGLRETVAAIEASGGTEATYAVVDLRSPEAIEGAVEAAAAAMGGIDVLVNNAADDDDSSFENTTLEIWQRIQELNSQSVFLLCKAAGPHLQASPFQGKVINLASVLGAVGVRDNSAYVASKHAVVGLTRALALEWARRGVQVNALCPGFVATDMTAHLHGDEVGSSWVVKRTPVGRWGQPTDMCGAGVFLASSASDFMTGQTVFVDGGYTVQ